MAEGRFDSFYEGRKKKEEGRRKKEEGRRKKEELIIFNPPNPKSKIQNPKS
ncbi:MAG: hypothetical protein MUE44_20350 [Oscillatoriaceae cyanobacterium Prado104]|jgi:hypothetical protein|nr:hypothetical protein [Oscillatoriaceae cyanobacterium Prado104]